VGAVLPICVTATDCLRFALLAGHERDELGVAKPERPGSAAGRQEPLSAVVLTDRDGLVNAWSDAAAEMTGLSAA
jgi:PAS domain-containing protein